MKTIKHNAQAYLQTGQTSCHDADGREIACAGSGQDAETSAGLIWPQPRFQLDGELVYDRLTGLTWPGNAGLAEFPLNWNEALDFVSSLNTETAFGFADWRLPNRRELRSLISHNTRQPALPEHHPFQQVFTNRYWCATTAAGRPDHAWYVNMDGGRMFFGGKDQAYMVWPVRGASDAALARTGQLSCYDSSGHIIPCKGSGQDGEYRHGVAWPEPRFIAHGSVIKDRLTGLLWKANTSYTDEPVTWDEALASIARLNHEHPALHWLLPNINQLESLIDAERHGPALPAGHPFTNINDIYWSSTTSLYEPDWAWALYLNMGAVGVGQKGFARFHVWAVATTA